MVVDLMIVDLEEFVGDWVVGIGGDLVVDECVVLDYVW